MTSAYDKYDYPSYWTGRDYEHQSELIAISNFLKQISSIASLSEIGAGYGRLTPAYLFRSQKVILSDPSACLLSIAKKNLTKSGQLKTTVIQSKIENLPGKIKPNSQDVILLVRVVHHLKDIDSALKIVHRLLKERGYLILEFANKSHFKAIIGELFKGNTTFLLDIFPKDIRNKRNIKKKTLPFINYHPDIITEKLKELGFEIIEKRSVSNFRHSLIKKFFPQDALLKLEEILQVPLSHLNFGPSVFVLCQKS